MLDLHSKYVEDLLLLPSEPPCSHLAPTFSFPQTARTDLGKHKSSCHCPAAALWVWFPVLQLQKDTKIFQWFTAAGLREAASSFTSLSLFLWLSPFSDTHRLPDDPRMCQASSHIRAFIVTLLTWALSQRLVTADPCWCLSSLCTDVTTSVKPHPTNRDCCTWQLISYTHYPHPLSCSGCSPLLYTVSGFPKLSFVHVV